MKSIEEIIAGCPALKPGDIVRIAGLKSSKQLDEADNVETSSYELLGPDGYADMQRKSLAILENTEFTDETIAEAATQMVASLRKSLHPDKPSGDAYKNAYVKIDDAEALYTLGSAPDSVYLLRLKRLGDFNQDATAKGEIPRMKQQLTKTLGLPTGRYVHAVKLTNGMFDSLEIG